MIKYERVGGFAGGEDALAIHDDGSLEIRSSISGRLVHDIRSKLAPRALRRLLSLFEADFFSFESEYLAESPVFDRIIYTLTYASNSRTKTITTDTGGNPPKGFQRIQKELDLIIEKLERG